MKVLDVVIWSLLLAGVWLVGFAVGLSRCTIPALIGSGMILLAGVGIGLSDTEIK